MICACASHWFNQGQPDATVAESREIFEFDEGMKFVVVFEVGLSLSCRFCPTFLGVTTLLDQEMLERLNRRKTL